MLDEVGRPSVDKIKIREINTVDRILLLFKTNSVEMGGKNLQVAERIGLVRLLRLLYVSSARESISKADYSYFKEIQTLGQSGWRITFGFKHSLRLTIPRFVFFTNFGQDSSLSVCQKTNYLFVFTLRNNS